MPTIEIYEKPNEIDVRIALSAARKVCGGCGMQDICQSTPSVCGANFKLKSSGNVYPLGMLRDQNSRAHKIGVTQINQE